MSCERFRNALAGVVAGGPAPDGLEAHLAACEACRAEAAGLRRLLGEAEAAMASLAVAEPSPDLAVRIREAVGETPASPVRRFGWLWPAAAVAAALLVALVVPRAVLPPAPTVLPGAVPLPSAAVIPRAVPLPSPEGSTGPLASAPARVARASEAVDPSSPAAAGAPRDDVPGAPPEVLVPPGETEALLRFAAHLQTRVVPPDSLLVADLSAPLAEPRSVEIAPLEIVPLDPAEASGTD